MALEANGVTPKEWDNALGLCIQKVDPADITSSPEEATISKSSFEKDQPFFLYNRLISGFSQNREKNFTPMAPYSIGVVGCGEKCKNASECVKKCGICHSVYKICM